MERTSIAIMAAALGLLLTPIVAYAVPEVVVHITGGGAGVTVTLTDAAGAVHSCSTDGTGSCEIDGVAPGLASVVAAQRGGSPTSPQTAMIPPDGKVSVIVPSP